MYGATAPLSSNREREMVSLQGPGGIHDENAFVGLVGLALSAQTTIPEEGVFIPGDYLTDGWLNGFFWEHATPMEREIFNGLGMKPLGERQTAHLGRYLQRPQH